MRRRLLLCGVIAVIAGLASCTVGTSAVEPTSTTRITTVMSTSAANAGGPDLVITGRWAVTEFKTDDKWDAVEFGKDSEGSPVAGANAHRPPWVEIGAEEMEGPLGGCNDMWAEYSLTGDLLTFDKTMSTAMACQPTELEDAVQSIFGPNGVVKVEVENDSMNWSTPQFAMRFRREE